MASLDRRITTESLGFWRKSMVTNRSPFEKQFWLAISEERLNSSS
jgi:hypothetical protein